MVEETRKDRLVVTASIGGLILVGTILVSIGQTLENVSHQALELQALKAEIAEVREYIEDRTGQRYRATDAQKDFAFVDQRLSRIEQRIERLEGKH